MGRNRMEAFSDGILAIVITIMVLKLDTPKDFHWSALQLDWPVFAAYLLSFFYVGIYWMNHHHLVSAVKRVSAPILWANLHWLFWMSLLPPATDWMGRHVFHQEPAVLYGTILLMCSVAYHILQRAVVWQAGETSRLARALQHDRKGILSLLANALGIALAFWLLPLPPVFACAIISEYVITDGPLPVACMNI